MKIIKIEWNQMKIIDFQYFFLSIWIKTEKNSRKNNWNE